MVETKFILDTDDGHKIHGVLNKAKGKKNKKAVLFIHGLPANCRRYVPSLMAHSFPQKGYDIIRIDLYSSSLGGRSIVDVTLKIHGQDIDTVITHFSKNYDKIFGLGHSYGGPSLILSDQTKFTAFSLWDPTYRPSIITKHYKKHGKLFISTRGSGAVIGQSLYNEAKDMDENWARKQSNQVKCPIQVIYAGHKDNSFWVNEGESFHTYASTKTDEKIIRKASHSFYEEGASEILFKHTLNWFNQF